MTLWIVLGIFFLWAVLYWFITGNIPVRGGNYKEKYDHLYDQFSGKTNSIDSLVWVIIFGIIILVTLVRVFYFYKYTR